MVDSQQSLILGGELHNSDSSSVEYMKQVWPRITKLNLNTVLTSISPELVEPRERSFDFTLIDDAIRGARQNRVHLVFLWFGTWKNGVSTYVPLWVKTDTKIPSGQRLAGQSMEVVSPLSTAARERIRTLLPP